MIGSRPLTKAEAQRVKRSFSGRNAARNRALFLLGANTGFRISELLSLRVGDILESDGTIVERVTVQRKDMKGGRSKKHVSGRTVKLNRFAKEALRQYLCYLLKEKKEYHVLIPDGRGGEIEWFVTKAYLFASERDPMKNLDRIQGWRILNRVYCQLGLNGKLGTHAMRKTFANNNYDVLLGRAAAGEKVDPLRAISKLLGHANLNNTDKYLSFREEILDEVIEEGGV